MSQNNEVYITKSNLNALKNRFKVAKEITNEIMKSEVYKKDISWILSNLEIEFLFVEKLILSKDERLNIISSHTRQNYQYLFGENKKPKYHRDQFCEFLKSNFENFEIPEEIKDKGIGEIEKFKKFAIDNKSLYHEDEQKFLQKIESHFFLKNPIKKVNYTNTGIEQFSELTIDNMEQEIDLHLAKCQEFMNANPERTKLIKDNTYAPLKSIKKRNLGGDVEEWHEIYKKNLRKMLSAYYAKLYNSKFAFNESFLSGLGFEGCRGCCVDLGF